MAFKNEILIFQNRRCMKFKLGNSENYVEVEIVYCIRESRVKDEFFIVTEALLSSYSLTQEAFVSFLKQDLDRQDPQYLSALNLWRSNKGVFSQTKASDNPGFEIEKIYKIITMDEEIILRRNRNKENGG